MVVVVVVAVAVVVVVAVVGVVAVGVLVVDRRSAEGGAGVASSRGGILWINFNIKWQPGWSPSWGQERDSRSAVPPFSSSVCLGGFVS